MTASEHQDGAAESRRRGRPSAETTQRRMAHLLDVARGIFVRRGYRATTMDEVAAAAGVTKRTLYAWHADKEALFRACVMLGAERFPRLMPDGASDLACALERYVVELHAELARADSYGMAVLFLREAAEFPELAASIQRGHFDYMVEPLAVFLRLHALEEPQSAERTLLFLAMALAPLHNAMLVGMALPTLRQVEIHARRVVGIMLGGGRIA